MSMASKLCKAGLPVFATSHYHHGEHPATLRAAPLVARFISTLFVGGLSFQTDENQLKDAFSSFGQVTEARIVKDKDTGRSKGFGFISFTSPKHAEVAIKTMDGRNLSGRILRVNLADKSGQAGYVVGSDYGGVGAYKNGYNTVSGCVVSGGYGGDGEAANYHG